MIRISFLKKKILVLFFICLLNLSPSFCNALDGLNVEIENLLNELERSKNFERVKLLCKNNIYGMIGDPMDCFHTYYVCHPDGRISRFECPSDLRFDDFNQVCDYKDKVKCK